MTSHASSPAARTVRPAWERALAGYQIADTGRALRQLLPTLAAYLGLLTLMVYLVRSDMPYVLVLPIALVAGGLLVRIFIFFHDACHGSFLGSRWSNTLVGYLCGVLTFTPYHAWRASHLRHHATAGDLDRRGMGDVWTLTVNEYSDAPWPKRLAYRLFRHPLVMFGLGPGAIFLLFQRLPSSGTGALEHLSVHATTLAIMGLAFLASRTIGLGTYLAVQLPVVLTGATFGVWLFYVQHQFEGVYWARHEVWDPIRAALEGSSFYCLPRALQWFSGNIGFHHIHHLRPRIPNYHLERCYHDIPELQRVRPLTLGASLRCLGLALWDEAQGRLVGFRALRRDVV